MIREFDLDAPRYEKSERLKFRNETRCVTALFERCYTPSKTTGKPWKILVEVVSSIERQNTIDLLGVLTVQVYGSPHEFLRMSAFAKMEKSLELLMAGISKIACEKRWDIAPFCDAATEVRHRNFINEWTWKPPIQNHSKSLFADVLVQHRVDKVEISTRFFGAEGNLVKVVHLVSDAPNEFIFDEYLGTFGWVNDSTVELVSRDGQKRFTAQAT